MLDRGDAADSFEVTVAQFIDDRCEQLEVALRAGRDVSIVDFLSDCPENGRDFLLLNLLSIDLEFRNQSGAQLQKQDYQTLFPDRIGVIEQAWERQFGIQVSEGTSIGQYRIQNVVGKGQFGTVYSAIGHDGAKVAIKFANLTDGPERQAIEREISIADGLTHHGIISILETGADEQFGPFLVMPLLSGKTLRDGLCDGPLLLSRSLDIAIQLSEAIEYLHSKNIIHQDLEPSNVLIDSSGNVVITDLGLAMPLGEQQHRAGELAGSPRYMSPEQIRGESQWLDGRTDVWSIGVILYELLTGAAPFSSARFEDLAAEILNRTPRPPRQLVATVPVDLEDICLKCLSQSIEDRYRTASDLRLHLRRVADELTQAEPAVQESATLQLSGTNGVARQSSGGHTRVLIWVGLGIVCSLALVLAVGEWNRRSIKSNSHDIDIVGDVSDGLEAFSLATNFDVVNFDILQPDGPTFEQRPQFTWEPVSGATSYEIYVNQSGSGTTTNIVNQTTTATSFTPTIDLPYELNDGSAAQYSWWIRPTDTNGIAGPWSAKGRFSPQSKVVNAEGTNGTSAVFTWLEVDGATSYTFWLRESATNQVIQLQFGAGVTSYTHSGKLASGSYKAWVKVTNAAGDSFWNSADDEYEFTVL